MWYTLRIFLKHYQNYTGTFPNVFSFLNLCFKYVNQWTIPLNAKKDYRKRKKINSQKVSPASPLPNYALDVFLVEIHKAKFAFTFHQTLDLNIQWKKRAFLSHPFYIVIEPNMWNLFNSFCRSFSIPKLLFFTGEMVNVSFSHQDSFNHL